MFTHTHRHIGMSGCEHVIALTLKNREIFLAIVGVYIKKRLIIITKCISLQNSSKNSVIFSLKNLVLIYDNLVQI